MSEFKVEVSILASIILMINRVYLVNKDKKSRKVFRSVRFNIYLYKEPQRIPMESGGPGVGFYD